MRSCDDNDNKNNHTNNNDGETKQYLFVTRPPEGGARFLVRSIDDRGWHEPELMTLGSLTRDWATAFDPDGKSKKVWELPMIELQADSSL